MVSFKHKDKTDNPPSCIIIIIIKFAPRVATPIILYNLITSCNSTRRFSISNISRTFYNTTWATSIPHKKF